VDNFEAGLGDWATGTSRLPPLTAMAPSAVCRKRGLVFVSMKVECRKSSPFNPMWE
jgi:hypothetical protein